LPGKAELQYDAFISYSHAVDSRLAPKLQAALEGFAKKWYQRRALRTFRDKTGLSATPALWPAIERALEQSRYFILLASPKSATSVWVQREVAWWLANRSVETILIVLTSGELVWDNAAADYDRTLTDSIPPMLQGRFAEEPLYVDLRWARDEEQLSLRHSQFRAAVVDLASTVHGRPRDELDGDDLRQHRRFKTAAWTAASALAILAVVSAAAAYLAIRNARLADAQRREAERQRDFATARQLAAESDRMVVEHPLNFERAALLTAVSLQRASLFENDFAARERLELLPEAPVVFRHGAAVRAVASSADDHRVLTGGDDGIARLWQKAPPRAIGTFQHGAPIWAVAFASEGRHLLTAGADGAIREWNAETGRAEIAVGFEVSSDLNLVAFSGDGSRAVTLNSAEDYGATIEIWDVAARQRLNQILFNQIVTSVSLDQRGERVLIGTWSKTVHVLKAKTSEEILRLNASDRLEAVAFSSDDSELVFATSDRMVRIFTARSDTREVASFRHPTGADSLALHRHQLLTGAPESSAVWDADSGAELLRVSHLGPVRAVAFSRDGGGIVTAGDDGSARVWRTQAGKAVQRSSCGSNVPRIGVNTDGRHISMDGNLILVGRCLHEPNGRTVLARRFENPDGAVLSQDGKVLAAVSGHARIAVFDFATGRKLSDLEVDNDQIWGLAISRDGRHVAAVSGQDGWRGRVDVWESAGGRSVAGFDYPNDGLYSIGFSADGRRIVIGSGDPSLLNTGEARILDLSTHRQLKILTLGGARPTTVSYSPDGRRLLTASQDGTVKIWDAESGREQVAIAQGGAVSRASWSEDGTRIATASSDQSAQVWDAQNGQELTRIRHRRPLNGVAFLPDGSSLVTAGDGFLEIHSLRAEQLVQQLCQRIRRNLTSAEWQKHMGTLPYRPTCGNQ
jgi:WD40 repeat protein